MNPWFVTGFTDGEGCFRVSVTTHKTCLTGFRVELRFQIGLHVKDTPLLEGIKNYFGVGNITKQGSESIQFRINSIKDCPLAVIIEHFDKYPLITQKLYDYKLFKQVYELMLREEHLTYEGLYKIVVIKAAMNLGLPYALKKAFPDIVTVVRPLVENKKVSDPNWLAGFTSGEGSFFVHLRKSKTHSLGMQVQLVFKVTQHMRDEQLLLMLIEYLDCGNIYKKGEIIDFRVSKLSDIINKIIPFFKKYPIYGVKVKGFADWCLVAEMMKENKHLTSEGLKEIKKIKAVMNIGRKN